MIFIGARLAGAADHAAAAESVSAEEAVSRLKAGNERFVRHEATHPDQGAERIRALSGGQHPFAVILSCSDSRVPPEVVFDQGLGDVFVVRVAGNSIDDAVLGSIEYAVEHLGSRLVVVMGHEKCGAVQAAISGHKEGGHIPSIARPIDPVVKQAQSQAGDPVHNAVVLNARHVAGQLKSSEPLLKKRVAGGTVEVLSAVYSLESGRVQFDSASDAAGHNRAETKPKP